MEESMRKFESLFKGFKDTLPLGISVFLYGIVYGVLTHKLHFSIWATLFMSLAVFAGASQMTAVQMLMAGCGPWMIIITVLIVNLRHYLMAASLSPYLKGYSKPVKLINAYFMTDESYAVTYSCYQRVRPSALYFLGSGLSVYIFWCSSGVFGYYCGNFIPVQLGHALDFAFAAAFIGMLTPLVVDWPVAITVLLAAVISVIGSLYLPGKWYIIIAAVVASGSGFLMYRISRWKNARMEMVHNE
ncbi:MAG TPA: branched-chain amino acid ABC transporter permease [Firmicutes bacterium]|jgi:4-azaleucine resistance transporter AzlC|nr:branched-chain amino acid ABC transporter permease [Bacillota bacterium]